MLQIRRFASESAADSDPVDDLYHDEVPPGRHRSSGPHSPRSTGHVLRNIQEDHHVVDAPSLVPEDTNSPSVNNGRMNTRRGTTSMRLLKANVNRDSPEPRSINQLGESSGRRVSSEQSSEIPSSSYLVRSTLASDDGSRRLGGSSEVGTDISPPSYRTMAPTSVGARRRPSYRST